MKKTGSQLTVDLQVTHSDWPFCVKDGDVTPAARRVTGHAHVRSVRAHGGAGGGPVEVAVRGDKHLPTAGRYTACTVHMYQTVQ